MPATRRDFVEMTRCIGDLSSAVQKTAEVNKRIFDLLLSEQAKANPGLPRRRSTSNSNNGGEGDYDADDDDDSDKDAHSATTPAQATNSDIESGGTEMDPASHNRAEVLAAGGWETHAEADARPPYRFAPVYPSVICF